MPTQYTRTSLAYITANVLTKSFSLDVPHVHEHLSELAKPQATTMTKHAKRVMETIEEDGATTSKTETGGGEEEKGPKRSKQRELNLAAQKLNTRAHG